MASNSCCRLGDGLVDCQTIVCGEGRSYKEVLQMEGAAWRSVPVSFFLQLVSNNSWSSC